MRFRSDPNMENISEVQETEDSTLFENCLHLHLEVPKSPLNNNKIRINKFDDYDNTNQVLRDFHKHPRKPKSKSFKIITTNTNMGISRFINNTSMSNVNISISDISTNKVENESIF